MQIKFNYNNMLKEFSGEHGFSRSDFLGINEKIESAKSSIQKKKSQGLMGFMFLPFNQDDVIEEILNYKEEMKNKIENIVILGIGGSALGTYVLHNALNHPYHNELEFEKRRAPKLYIADNIDPERLYYIINTINIEKTLFNVVTKSGETIETLSQFMIIKKLLGKKAKERIVITTDSENGSLIKIAKTEGFKTFFIPKGVCGRFSILTPVALLPAAFLGIDIKEILKGAAMVDEDLAVMFAVLKYIAILKGKNISVVMPYADRLRYVSDWYSQLFSESLSKKFDNNQNIVNTGLTTLKALGVTDQHSQLQLYIEGPFDKVIVFLDVEEYLKETINPKNYENIPSFNALSEIPHSKLIKLEKKATEASLTKASRINMSITLPKVNEFTIGQLLYMLELSCAFLGELMNINAFNQPGVEDGKQLTLEFLKSVKKE